jgi:hypothetical protein
MKRSEWPTLGEMINTRKKVVVFMDKGADGSVDFILPQFSMVCPLLECHENAVNTCQLWEPPYSSTDPTFPCRVDRIEGPLSTEDHLSMLNHNLNAKLIGNVLVSDPLNAPKTNGIQSSVSFNPSSQTFLTRE